MKIASFKRDITPEIGIRVAGYGMEDVSLSKLTNLYMTGLLADDNERRVLLISFDLQCMDEPYICRFRKEVGDLLNIPEHAVMLTFTHTHGGPQLNTEAGYDDHLMTGYLEELGKMILEECRTLPDRLEECNAYFYSMQVDENSNRRCVLSDNSECYIPYRAEMRPVAHGYADQELGSLVFLKKGQRIPLLVLGNYAAHPLAAHGPGSGGLRISADYPEFFRNYVTEETGAPCIFVSGACGDMIPKEDEMGAAAAKEMGIRLGKNILRGILDIIRNWQRFRMYDPKVGSITRKISVPLRPCYRNNPKTLPSIYLGKDNIELEIQCLLIGDVCFVGVPGEMCAELGLEIKWHSPFKKAFIAFGATGYQEYICPANFLLQGGYEAQRHHFKPQYSIDLVKLAVDTMFSLRDELHPVSEDDDDYVNDFNQFDIVVKPTRGVSNSKQS